MNDCLYTGPKLQVDIVKMFLNFRLFKIVLIADLCQMYRQIRMNPQDQRFQRILWRFSENDSVNIYELTTVTFGVKPSPYLALRTLRQLALDEAKNYPKASKTVLEDMYVHDLITSVDSVHESKELYHQLTALFKSVGFEITKWHSNALEFLNFIPEEKRSQDILSFEKENIKVLGMQWQSEMDILAFNINELVIGNEIITKRTILSQISRIFDLLGLLGPVVLYAKLQNFLKEK